MSNLIIDYQKQYEKKNIAKIKPGDIIRVHQKITEGGKSRIQIFEGIILRVRGGKSLDGTFTVRKISFGVGVEKVFPLHLPSIVKIEKIKSIKVRKSRLYYLRNLTDKQIRRQGELKDFETWEEPVAKEEEEKLQKEKEEAAKKKAEAKKKEQEEMDKKFATAQAAKTSQEHVNTGTQEQKNTKPEKNKK